MENVKQSKSYTCGPAALATILKAKGISADEQELIKLCGTDKDGTSMYGLLQGAIKKGCDAGAYSVPVENLRKLDLVYLKINDSCHFSVIEEIAENSIKLLDPAMDRIEFSFKYFKTIYGNAVIRVMD